MTNAVCAFQLTPLTLPAFLSCRVSTPKQLKHWQLPETILGLLMTYTVNSWICFDVVLAMPHDAFEHKMDALKAKTGAVNDLDYTADDLRVVGSNSRPLMIIMRTLRLSWTLLCSIQSLLRGTQFLESQRGVMSTQEPIKYMAEEHVVGAVPVMAAAATTAAVLALAPQLESKDYWNNFLEQLNPDEATKKKKAETAAKILTQRTPNVGSHKGVDDLSCLHKSSIGAHTDRYRLVRAIFFQGCHTLF
jgi:hypothetical protein